MAWGRLLHHSGLMSMGGHLPTRSQRRSPAENARRTIIENHLAIERSERRALILRVGDQSRTQARKGSTSPCQSTKRHRDARAALLARDWARACPPLRIG